MGLCSTPNIPDPAKSAAAGIQADLENQPFSYLVNAASTLGNKLTIDGQTYDFTGLGQADTAGIVSDKMAKALLDLQKEKSPAIIQQRLKELQAADPQGFAARKQLFDRIMADAQQNPDRPVATELQQQLQTELAKGVGFDNARQAEEVREGVRGGQFANNIFLGNAPAAQEASTLVNTGEALRNQRESNALALLESGASPEDVAYRRMQQNISNLGSFASGQTPEAQFKQVSAAGTGPVSMYGGAPNTNNFNPNAAGQGLNNALALYTGQTQYNQSQANPWLAGLGFAATGVGTIGKINPGLIGHG